jgi:DNA-binding CsgD family transcriptional regulator/tetratricopeptide (TPR) repeat protein
MDLVERDDALAVLLDALAAVQRGAGGVCLIGAEAGGGKTALVERFLRRAPNGIRVRRGWCDGLATPRPLGPFVDMLGDALRAAIGPGSGRTDAFGVLGELLGSAAPAVLVIEDLHWADEATVDALRFLARRASLARALVVATYRDDGLDPRTPAGMLVGELATVHGVRRIHLEPLSIAGVAALLDGTEHDPVPVHAVTAGNPFFVCELRAAPAGTIPLGVRDAVLGRAARLDPAARAALDAAAVLGLRTTPELVATVAGCDDEALDRCVAAGFLRGSLDGVAFGHELARLAIEEAIPPGRRRVLHRRALETGERGGGAVGVERLVRHAEAAGDDDALVRLALRAGEAAAAAGSHREAAAQFRRAAGVGSVGAAERAAAYERLSYHCYVTADIDGALDAVGAALALRRELGDRVGEGVDLRWLSRLAWFRADRRGATAAIHESIAILEAEQPGLELAWAYSHRSQLAMTDSDAPTAVAYGRRALALDPSGGDHALRAHALNNIGAARLHAGEPEGWIDLEAALSIALEHDLHEHAARAYTNLAWSAVEERAGTAERWLAEGIEYAAERDLDAWCLYQLGARARFHLHAGRFDAAVADARAVVEHPRATPVACHAPLVVIGLVAARRGETAEAAQLDEAQAVARASGEIQRLAPIAVAAAEAAWLAGHALPVDLLASAHRRACRRSDVWSEASLALWLARAGGELDPAGRPEPLALQLAGAHAEGAEAWLRLGSPYDAALALLDAGDADSVRRAIGLLDELGAPASAARARVALRRLGVPVPLGPRRSTRANPAGLTCRELEVLRLLKTGASDAEIARQLVISVRTAGHHVSSILRKLDVPTRSRAAARAEALLADPEPVAGR